MRELAPDVPIDIHVVDPYPAGGGRIWRAAQSPLLWMNSVAADVTVFTDSSVTCEGPIVPGPSLAEWIFGEGSSRLHEANLDDHVSRLDGPSGFASRAVQAEYLAWAFDRVVNGLPSNVRVTTHQEAAVEVAMWAGGARVELASGTRLDADAVVLAQGHLDRAPTRTERKCAAAARRHGLTYVPPGFTADLDLDALPAGEPVLVSGFGLAFIDLMVLLGEGRGGTFHEHPDGGLDYEPSGREPVLHVGSRRGVPYHAKLGYTVSGDGPVPPRHLTRETVAAISEARGALDYELDVRPLIDKELTAAHYARLFGAHPERVLGAWEPLEEILRRTSVEDPAFVAAVEAAVPAATDRFVIEAVDRPLEGLAFGDRTEFTAHLVGHIEADLRRRADPSHSPDLAVFNALVTVFGVLAEVIADGRVTAVDRVLRVESEFAGLFSFLASGPPPRRLRELLALHRAGVVHFLGPDLEITVEDGRFVARSPAVPGTVTARAFVEARLPKPDVLSATDPVLRGLLDQGQLAAEHLVDPEGFEVGGGLLLADRTARAIRPDGTPHDRLFLLGPAVSGSAGSAGFARPGFNGAGFRQNDAVARHLLRLLSSGAFTQSNPSTRKETHHDPRNTRPRDWATDPRRARAGLAQLARRP